ncbi:MAG: choice-of-anchor L domain-containing protein [Bacteroidota bacterium]
MLTILTPTPSCQSKGILLIVLSLLAISHAFSQLVVTGGHSGSTLADTLTGDGITISNVVLNCPNGASGIFNGTNSNIGIDRGVLLTTGNITNAAGLNNTLNDIGTNNGAGGDPVLDFLAGAPTLDACALEFDIVATCDIIQIAYVFASEEYPNFVGFNFNDIFAFIISGPGIPPGGKNIALIPGSITPVSINNVNAGLNNNYYVSNPAQAGSTVKYNGFTTSLLALTQIQPCQTYHLKLVVADGTDGNFDSGVFLDLGGIRCFQNRTSLQAAYSISGSDHGVEGCNDVQVNVFRTGDSTQSKTVDFSVAGTATNGVDYTGMPSSLVFPPLRDSLGFVLSIPDDGMVEGMEFIQIVVRDSLCNVMTTDTLIVPIYDPARVDPGADTTICVNASYTLTPSVSDPGGVIAWSPATVLDDSSLFGTTFTPPGPGTYTLQVQFADTIGCPASDSILITVPPFTMGISKTDVDCHGTNTGSATASITGVAPYTFVWKDGSNAILQTQTSNSGTNTLSNLGPGTYVVLITDGEGCTDSLTTTITEPPTPLSAVISNQVDVLCNGEATGSVDIVASGGTSPYQFEINGLGFSTNNVFTSLAAGTYSVGVQDSNNCLFILTTTITEPTAMTSAISSQTNVDCQGNASGSVSISVNGGVAPYQYSIDGLTFQSSSTFSGLVAGIYTITIRDANLCTHPQAVSITEPSALGIALTNQLNVDCNGNATGAVDVSGSGGTAPYLFAINGSPLQSSGSFSGLAAGTYTISIQDDSLCTASLPITITEPQVLTASINSQINVDCNGNNTGSVDILAVGGTAPYSFGINGGTLVSSSLFNNLPAGTYTIDVRDANNCASSVLVSITEPAILTATVTNRVDVDCFGNNTGILSVAGGGGTLPYSFSINQGPFVTSGTFTNLFAGLYTLSIQDAQGCIVSVDTMVTTPTGLTGGIDTLIHILCQGQSTGSASFLAIGGATPYVYSLDGINFTNTNTFTGLPAGPDTVTIRDANTCIFRVPFVLTEPLLLQAVVAGTTPVLCQGDSSGTLSASATGGVLPYVYSLDGVNYQSSPVFSNLPAGVHTLFVQDSNLCEHNIPFTITEPTDLGLAITAQQNVDCNGNSSGQIELMGSGGVSPYEFSLDGGPFGSAPSFSGLAAASYMVHIQDANLCLDSILAIISEPAVLSGGISEQKNVSCQGESNAWVDVFANGGTAPYLFSIDGINFQSSSLFQNLTAGTYTVTIQDDSACLFQVPINITEPLALSINLLSQQNVDCFGNATAELVFGGSGGVAPYQYHQLGFLAQSSGTFSSLLAGSYITIIEDDSLCTDTLKISVSEPDLLTLTIDSIRHVDCFGNSTGEVFFHAAGGTPAYVYSLSTGATSVDTTFSGFVAGAYTVTTVDDSSCLASTSFVVSEPAVLTASIVYQKNVACHGDSSAEIGIQAQGGTLPYEYSLNGGTFGGDSLIRNLPVGTHIVTVRDSQACEVQVNILITEPPLLFPSIVDLTHVDCFGNATASVTIAGSGGTLPYSFSLDSINYQGSGTFAQLPAGSYTAIVVDDSNCVVSLPFVVNEPMLLQAQIDRLTNVDCSGNSTGLLDITATGGSNPYLFSLNGGSFRSSGLFENLSAGQYTIVVEDMQACRDTLIAIQVTEPDELMLLTTHTDVRCHGENSGTAKVSATGGTMPYQYLWEDGQPNETAINLSVGSYQVIVTDAQGCVAQAIEAVNEPDTLLLSLGETSDPFCDWANGSATVNATGGILEYRYSWDTQPSQNSNQAINLVGGRYLAMVSDANGCVDTLSVWMNNTPQPIPDFATLPDLTDSILLSQAHVQFQNLTIGGVVYEWELGDGTKTADPEPQHQYENPGLYTIKLTAYNEFLVCPVSITKTIHIIPDGVVYIPNAFTPNGDGQNDAFFVKGEGIVSLSMIIYDRWGGEIYRLSNPEQQWYGLSTSGTVAPEGVYTFAIQATFNSGAVLKRGGTITLIR